MSKPPTQAELAEWRDKTDAATAEPWELEWESDYDEYKDKSYRYPIGIRGVLRELDIVNEEDEAANLIFIALARTAMPRLLDEVGRLRKAEADNYYDCEMQIQGGATVGVQTRSFAEGVIRDGDNGDLLLEPVWPHQNDPVEELGEMFRSLVNKRVLISVKVGDAEPVRERLDASVN